MNNKISANVQIPDDFLDRIAFDCDKCGARAEHMSPDHPEWYEFCDAQGRNPNEMMFAFRKSCDASCTGELKMVELSTFDSFNAPYSIKSTPVRYQSPDSPYSYNLVK